MAGKELYLANSLNPYRTEGQKTLAFEIWEQLRKVPDVVIVPVGNAGNIGAIWRGFWELRKLGVTKRTPRMIGVQAAGVAPIAAAYARRETRGIPWSRPETVAGQRNQNRSTGQLAESFPSSQRLRGSNA